MGDAGIASILHRDAIAVLVGGRTFERGERCFADGRVVDVRAAAGELRGSVRPLEAGRAPYVTRMWVRDDGLAYECTCPVGASRVYCKHVVAVALAHLAAERTEAERGVSVLREALTALPAPTLVDGLVRLALRDPAVADDLKRMCLDALARL